MIFLANSHSRSHHKANQTLILFKTHINVPFRTIGLLHFFLIYYLTKMQAHLSMFPWCLILNHYFYLTYVPVTLNKLFLNLRKLGHIFHYLWSTKFTFISSFSLKSHCLSFKISPYSNFPSWSVTFETLFSISSGALSPLLLIHLKFLFSACYHTQLFI